MKVSLLQNNIWQMQPRGRWQEISAPFRWVLRSAFPCQEAESLMQKNPAMPRETLGNSPSIIVCFSSMNPYFKHISTQKRAPRSSVFRGTLQICLGERLNGIQEVGGSIPLVSATRSLETLVFQGFFHARNFRGPRATFPDQNSDQNYVCAHYRCRTS